MENMIYNNILGKIGNNIYENAEKFLLIIFIFSTIILSGVVSDTFQSFQTIPQIYKLSNTSIIGLKTYVEFTGNQFLIINHSGFDWTNVIFEVKAAPVTDNSSEETLKSKPVVLNVPRIRAGGTYTVSTTPLRAGAPRPSFPLDKKVLTGNRVASVRLGLNSTSISRYHAVMRAIEGDLS
jgi:hypothetical protein